MDLWSFNEESVSNNLNDGILREYYEDGNLKIEYNYDNGKKMEYKKNGMKINNYPLIIIIIMENLMVFKKNGIKMEISKVK